MWRKIWEFITSPFMKWLATTCVAVLGIYGTFFYQHKPDIAFDIVSSANVLDIRESLNKLAIVYDGTDLRATNQNLHLLVLRIVNRGSANVLKSDFDDSVPLGFKVSVGKIVESPVIIAERYLKDNLHPMLRDERTVTFSPVIINAGDSFQVRALLLIPEGATLTMTPIGKIAGVKAMSVSNGYAEAADSGYFHQVFSGAFRVQAGRLVFYFFACIAFIAVLVAGIGIPASAISEKLAKRRRGERVRKYRETVSRRLSLKEEYLAAQYIQNTPVFNAFLRIVRRGDRTPDRSPRLVQLEFDSDSVGLIRRDFKSEYEELAENGLIVMDGPQIEVVEDFAQLARELVNFLLPVSTKALPHGGQT
jgi:hypothetical protein